MSAILSLSDLFYHTTRTDLGILFSVILMIDRPVSLVLVEAILIGLLTLAIYTGVSKAVKDTRALILTGALVHLFFEYSPMGNLNERYCKYLLKA
jgi:hypothetical protein